jgi:F-type H+-transporting ATPase subunit b
MGLVTPAIGLVFWTTLSFLIVLFLLKKMAWKPILSALKERETAIEDALKSADQARAEMEALQAGNEKLLKEARAERDVLLKEARDAKDAIINEAKDKAKTEGDKMIAAATASIENQKMAAITELKNQVASLSLEIAEKILKSELSSKDKQEAIVQQSIKDLNLN